MEEIEYKIGLLRETFPELEGILIGRNDDFSWITAGGRGWVDRSSERSVAWILVTKTDSFLVVNNIESERMVEEEVPDVFGVVEYRWYENPLDVVRKLVGGDMGSDIPGIGRFVGDELRKLRMVLTEWETERALSLGEELQGVFENSLLRAEPDMTERELASIVESELVKSGFEVPVLLVFSDERRKMYRHNLPSSTRLGERFFVSVCARKKGIVLSTTRTLSFVKDPDFERQHEINAEIDAEIRLATRPGKTLSEMFLKIRSVYEKHGFGGEFEKHHQGGIGGYNPREEKANPISSTKLEEGMMIAWNPTITGTKSEDTFILDLEGYMTFTGNSIWPVLEFEIGGKTLKRPGVRSP